MSTTDYLFVCLGIIKEALCQECLSSYLYCSNLSVLLVFRNILGKMSRFRLSKVCTFFSSVFLF